MIKNNLSLKLAITCACKKGSVPCKRVGCACKRGLGVVQRRGFHVFDHVAKETAKKICLAISLLLPVVKVCLEPFQGAKISNKIQQARHVIRLYPIEEENLAQVNSWYVSSMNVINAPIHASEYICDNDAAA
jgi:hypothetical protein